MGRFKNNYCLTSQNNFISNSSPLIALPAEFKFVLFKLDLTIG